MAEIPAVYMDSCCFIEVVKHDISGDLDDRRKIEAWRIQKLLEANRDGAVKVCTSALSIAEALHIGMNGNPVPQRVQEAFEALPTSGNYTTLIQPGLRICEAARNLRWHDRISIRGADGILLASAIAQNCSEFLSLNGRLNRVGQHSDTLRQRGITVLKPSNTGALPDSYRQKELFDGP